MKLTEITVNRNEIGGMQLEVYFAINGKTYAAAQHFMANESAHGIVDKLHRIAKNIEIMIKGVSAHPETAQVEPGVNVGTTPRLRHALASLGAPRFVECNSLKYTCAICGVSKIKVSPNQIIVCECGNDTFVMG